MYYVYILVSLKDQRFYVGSTKDLRKRFSEHKSGVVESTRHRRPLHLLGYEAYLRLDEAVVRERYLKSSDARKEFRLRFAKSLNDCFGEVPKRLKGGDC